MLSTVVVTVKVSPTLKLFSLAKSEEISAELSEVSEVMPSPLEIVLFPEVKSLTLSVVLTPVMVKSPDVIMPPWFSGWLPFCESSEDEEVEIAEIPSPALAVLVVVKRYDETPLFSAIDLAVARSTEVVAVVLLLDFAARFESFHHGFAVNR